VQGNFVTSKKRSAGNAPTGVFDAAFDGERDGRERTGRQIAREFSCDGMRGVGIKVHECVQLRLKSGDARELSIEQLKRRNLFFAKERSDFGNGSEVKRRHGPKD